MLKFKMSVCVMCVAATLLFAGSAYADTCHVTTLSGAAVAGSLRHALANQPGAGGGNNCNIIDFAVAGVINLTAQIHINKDVSVDGQNKITLKPAVGYAPVVADKCFVRMINGRSNAGTETTAGEGGSQLLNITIDANNNSSVKYGVCVYSSGNNLLAVKVMNETVAAGAGILIRSDLNFLRNAEVHNNKEGVIVDAVDNNEITMSNFWSNTGIGISLINGGNSDIVEPSDILAIHGSSLALTKYLIVGTIDSDTNKIEFFNVDTDNKEGKRYLLNRSITNVKKTTIRGKTYFAAIVENIQFDKLGGITITTRDSNFNTSQFADRATLFESENIDACLSSEAVLFENYAMNPTHNPCVAVAVDDCSYTTCGDIAGNPECSDEFSQCCAAHPADAACTTTTCPDTDHDTICDTDDNCPYRANVGQLDTNGNGTGDVCEYVPSFNICLMLAVLDVLYGDTDHDGVVNSNDNCQNTANGPCAGVNNQLDFDHDGLGDLCDNCPAVFNPNQSDTYGCTAGDACEVDQDGDNDGVQNSNDNCPNLPNEDQLDNDADSYGDACDSDIDGDSYNNFGDNCPLLANHDQMDIDGDGVGDVCDPVPDGAVIQDDIDYDGIPDRFDNCIFVPNTDQADINEDGIGDACEGVASNDSDDIDGDGIENADDNCPVIKNPSQEDANGNNIGDVCENSIYSGDLDGDLIPDWIDNCITVRNSNQLDSNNDGIGNACASVDNSAFYDIDGDTVQNITTVDDEIDNCPFIWNPQQEDKDNDSIGDACDIDLMLVPPDEDLDGDGVKNHLDNCPAIPNTNQQDSDSNGIGDVCQLVDDNNDDFDGDGIDNTEDNCPVIPNPDQLDSNGNGVGDVCDAVSAFNPSISGSGEPTGSNADDINIGGKGPGCSLAFSASPASTAGVVMMLAAMVALLGGIRIRKRNNHMKKIIVVLICMVCFVCVGLAPVYALNVQSATPNIGFTGTFNLFGAETLKQNHFSTGFVLDYTRKPLEFHNFTTGATVRGIVDYLVTTDFIAEYGIVDRLTAGLDVPLQVSSHMLLTNMAQEKTGFGLGDITAYAKYALIKQQGEYPIGLSIMPFVTAPTGNSSDFFGDAGVDIGAKAILDRDFGGGFVNVNVGFKGRLKTDHMVVTGSTSTLNVGHELLYGLGGGVNLVGKKLELIGELVGSTTIENFGDKQTSPIQINGGLRSTLLDKQLSLHLGAGGGLNSSYSSPQFRVFSGLVYHFPREKKVVVKEKMIKMTLEGVLFDFDKSNLKPTAIPKLERNIVKLKAMMINRINVVGYTDSKGTEAYNQVLSMERAQVVKDYLVSQGIASDRIMVEGRGESGAVAPNTTPAGNDDPIGRAKNRRAIELQIWTQ
ncbi:MAG: thrombospondin type 3 repeat-containing protein [Deltaproteobacteria bacterium]|nr:thrombospondin type 3 repeat-containing protein [Deltaproteobacteria bacterium]